MSNLKSKEPRERILEVSARLFSQKGYSAIGVREIAKEAEVNISMISYYFNGKLGILKTIIEKYFQDLDKILNAVKSLNLPREEALRMMIRNIVYLIKNKTDFCKVAILEMPFDVPEIQEFKVKMLEQYIRMIRESFHDGMPGASDNEQNMIIGPALISLIFSNFILGQTLESVYKIDYSNKFYDKYSNTISTLFISGIMGIAMENRKLKESQTN